jgi:hypothetical protein
MVAEKWSVPLEGEALVYPGAGELAIQNNSKPIPKRHILGI